MDLSYKMDKLQIKTTYGTYQLKALSQMSQEFKGGKYRCELRRLPRRGET